MTAHDVERLVDRGESDRVEFKQVYRASDVREVVCAFANNLAGHAEPSFVLVGVKKDGSNAGLLVDDELLQKLGQIRSGGDLQPLPSIDVERVDYRDGMCAVVSVREGRDPPVRYKGRIWVRIGSTTQIASEQDERRLVERRVSSNLPFDHAVVEIATLADLDVDFFRSTYLPAAFAQDVLESNGRTVLEQLTSLRFARANRPTVAGLLVVGKDPQAFIPGAYVQFARFAGRAVTDPTTDEKVLTGRIDAVASALLELIALAVPVALDRSESGVAAKVPKYPLAALRELIVNAIMHRNYAGGHAPIRVYSFDDRIEVSNPGGPYGNVRRENFAQGGVTAYRNPTVAEALKALGFAQRFGYGIPFVQKALVDNGNPAPRFEVEDAFVSVVVKARS